MTFGVIDWMFAKVNLVNQKAETQKLVTSSNVQQDEFTKQRIKNDVQGNSIEKQLEIKASLDLLRSDNVNEVFQSPQNPAIFYYATVNGNGNSIVKLDTSKDKNYLQNKYPNIPELYEFLYTEKLEDSNEFRGVGFDGNKFVFFMTNKDNSPGPCTSSWLGAGLYYIDTDIKNSEKKPYIASAEKIKEAKDEIVQCEKETFGN